MRKLVAASLIGLLVAGVLAGPAVAKKKKKKPVPVSTPVTYFLRADDNATMRLSLTDGPDAGSGYPDGPLAQMIFEPILGYLPDVWAAADGLPFTLDATKAITGTIVTEGLEGVVGAGQVTIDISLAGSVGGTATTIGTASETFTALPNSNHVTEFSITPDAALAGLVFDTFELSTVLYGPVFGHGFYELDDPLSKLTLSTLALPPR